MKASSQTTSIPTTTSDEPVELTEDELICLEIGVQGGPMLAIGRWEEPVKHLASLGLMKEVCGDYVITPAGKERLKCES